MKLSEYFPAHTTKKTLVSASKDFGVSISVFWDWVKGNKIPSRKNMLKIVEWSNGQVTPNDFYLNSDNQNAN